MGKSRRYRGWPLLPEPLAQAVIDNHTHLPLHEGEIPQVEGVKLALEEQLRRAAAVGVKKMITSGCEWPELAPTIELAQAHPPVYCALAIHPNEAPLHQGIVAKSPDGNTYQPQEYHRQHSLAEAIEEVAKLLGSCAKAMAVGETGLDYFRTSEQGKVAQKESFRAHIALAKELDLPLQIHDRDAHADVIEILQKEGAPARTVFHCFSGDREVAKVLAQAGWYASIAGPVTYNANQWLREAVQVMPKELILVETDAPYLTPHPHRGQPNASYMTPWTVRKLAELWEDEEAVACERLVKNTVNVYGDQITVE